MSDRDALLAAITAEPDDDTPRLVYADWLQEHGEDDRAEFIRAQCRLEHLPPHSDEAKRLAARTAELRAKLFGHLDALGFEGLTFRRGFVGSVTAHFETFCEPVAGLRPEDAPAFEWVVGSEEEREAFYPGERQVREALARPEVLRCVALDLTNLGVPETRTLLASEHLVNLRRLNFPENEAGPAIECIASPTFANLRWANFNNSDSFADCPSIIPLAECPHLANLEYLDFGMCELHDDDAEAVANARYWNRLRYLSLSASSFTAGIITLFYTQHLPALAELDVSATLNDIGTTANSDEYTFEIAHSSLFARLSKIWLQNNNLNDDAAKALAAAPREVKLTLLDLTGNPISETGQRLLRERFGEGVCVFDSD